MDHFRTEYRKWKERREGSVHYKAEYDNVSTAKFAKANLINKRKNDATKMADEIRKQAKVDFSHYQIAHRIRDIESTNVISQNTEANSVSPFSQPIAVSDTNKNSVSDIRFSRHVNGTVLAVDCVVHVLLIYNCTVSNVCLFFQSAILHRRGSKNFFPRVSFYFTYKPVACSTKCTTETNNK